jgi:hypothetical protein
LGEPEPARNLLLQPSRSLARARKAFPLATIETKVHRALVHRPLQLERDLAQASLAPAQRIQFGQPARKRRARICPHPRHDLIIRNSERLTGDKIDGSCHIEAFVLIVQGFDVRWIHT